MKLPVLTAFVILMFSCHRAAGQAAAEQGFLGKWISKDTGIIITPEFIGELYKYGDHWSVTTWPNTKFQFVAGTVKQDRRSIEGWIAASYTSRREYLVDGQETSIETVVYRACRVERADTNQLRLLLSEPYAVHKENESPEVKVPEEAKAQFGGRYSLVRSLRRLAE